MSGMYPNNQDIEIFGEQVSWPGVDASGKFTNGSFHDPMAKPSFIPAETINLILDNLESLIRRGGATPNSTGTGQLAGLLSELADAKKIVVRDGAGRAKVAAPAEPDDIARLADIASASPHGYGMYQDGRNLMEVLGVPGIREAMEALSERCNGTGVPNFVGLQIGDYIDGIDLSSIPAENNGDAGQPWNDVYKNNRIVISGFNTYRNFNQPENVRNHILFTFRNVPLRKRMNATNTSEGGYVASDMRAFLEGLNGDGTGAKAGVATAVFLDVLREQLGDCLLTIRKLHGTMGTPRSSSPRNNNYTLFLPSELEVLGSQNFGEEGYGMATTNVHFPIFSHSGVYRIKRYNGVRQRWSLQTPSVFIASGFTGIDAHGHPSNIAGHTRDGCAPAFCVA